MIYEVFNVNRKYIEQKLGKSTLSGVTLFIKGKH